ncbi:PREDICTED: G protein-activated inward rectifier potassium channel 3-like isoform X2 [Nicrophorus vespilloides]|uniref:G protein-activated inward rectifier potassium channel 3-like isoform X2 n=1 Tax=Nicrophorus vespilloides TaxID=110193 RepID=A0ABM1MSS9_NICVS|nr:PREDICTED: G protein-activated inward rectifier potassium channel 3-like isoform X2 [Nicrophorus vespilloides]
MQRQNRNPKRPVRRLIKKNGHSNVIRTTISSLRDRYWRDLGNTLVNLSWLWTLFCLTACFMLSWTMFATVWMLIGTSNSDNFVNNTTPCLVGIEGFTGYMMFSIETQQTIGYGGRYITNNCPEGTFLISLQMILSGAICGGMVCIVNAKLVRPIQRFSKHLFSKKAVINLRDGELCLIFRIRDDNMRYAIGTTINAYLVQSRVEEPFLKSVTLEPFGLLLWPLEIVHKITPSSPFWDLSAKELITKQFELIVMMTGTSAITGQSSKTRGSYLSKEIFWGSRFRPCVYYNSLENSYFVDHALFDEIEETSIPLCSAQRLGEVIEEIITPNPEDENRVILTELDVYETCSPSCSRAKASIASSYDSLNHSSYENITEEMKEMRLGKRRAVKEVDRILERVIKDVKDFSDEVEETNM